MTAMPNQLMIDRLTAVAKEAAAAGHGQRGAIYEAAAKDLCISLATLHRHLKAVTVRPVRKRRADAGQVGLSRDEALLIAAYIMESARKNNKRLATLQTAVEVLRANGEIVAARTDDTGAVTPLSLSAIRRALFTLGLHPDQLLQPAPKQQLASLHPNHVWQIDPSLCVLYYLKAETGMRAMPHDEFYKNKPANLERVAHDRVWRYVITDHTSGAFYVEYVLGAESAHNLCNCFINAMQRRGPHDPFHGAPIMVMLDPGSANTAAAFRNLCLSLGIALQINLPGQPWAKGQVEQANNLIELEFEHGLKRFNIQSLDELNAKCWLWMTWFNATRAHTRTQMTRYECWMKIRPEQLRIAPPADICRELAINTPQERVVSVFLQVSYRGTDYDVSGIPGVLVGQKLLITRNAFNDQDTAQVVRVSAEGHQVFHVVQAVRTNEFGFTVDSAVIGQNYKVHKQTPAQRAADEVEKLVMGAATLEEAAQKRKARHLPFSDRNLNPYKAAEDAVLPTYMPRAGTALDIPSHRVEAEPLTHFDTAKRLRGLLGDLWSPDLYAWLQREYPAGVPEGDIESICNRIKNVGAPQTGLRLVGGL